jgi:serine/threonine-protein kinase RsbW
MSEQRPVVEMLPSSVESVGRARKLATRVGEELLAGEQRDNLSLVVTELVSNAVRHSASADPVKVSLTPKDDYVCIQVTDSGRGLVPEPGAIGDEPVPGYGLFLVEQLTRRWGMTREEGRTRVWAEIDFAAAPARGQAGKRSAA